MDPLMLMDLIHLLLGADMKSNFRHANAIALSVAVIFSVSLLLPMTAFAEDCTSYTKSVSVDKPEFKVEHPCRISHHGHCWVELPSRTLHRSCRSQVDVHICYPPGGRSDIEKCAVASGIG